MRLSSNLVDFLISLTLEKKEFQSFKVLEDPDFNDLEKALFFNKLEPRFINFLRQNNITKVNKDIDLKNINKAANIRGLHNLSILNNASDFFANLNNRKIDYRLLKGAYINTYNKKLSGFRPIKDIDILNKYNKKNSSFVAVTVNPTDYFIKENLLGNFEYIQLHGSETNERVSEIKNMGFKIIKAIKVKEKKTIDKYKEFTSADIILFDTPGMEKSLEFPKNLIFENQ